MLKGVGYVENTSATLGKQTAIVIHYISVSWTLLSLKACSALQLV